jgi:hypothetical protein
MCVNCTLARGIGLPRVHSPKVHAAYTPAAKAAGLKEQARSDNLAIFHIRFVIPALSALWLQPSAS